jgi:hypothetical protein
MPGCARGFNQAEDVLSGITRVIQIGEVMVRGIPLQPMMELMTKYLRKNPLGLLCDDPVCAACSEVRRVMGTNTD